MDNIDDSLDDYTNNYINSNNQLNNKNNNNNTNNNINNNNNNKNENYFTKIYKSINNYFSNNNNDNNNNNNNNVENLNKKDSASNNNLNNQQQQQQQTQYNSNNSNLEIGGHDTTSIISNIKSIIKDDKSIHGNSYNLKPLENYELDEDILKKQTANSSSSSSKDDSSGSSSNNNNGNILNTISNKISNTISSTISPDEQQQQQQQPSNSNNKLELDIDKMDDKIEPIDDSLMNKAIGLLGKRRFYEILFLFGSASIISYGLRTLYFGKTIRVIEIDGDLTTIVLRSNSFLKLKKSIIQNQPPIYPGVELTVDDIKCATFIDPHFTEPILSNRDVRRLDDGGYVLFTKSEMEIPRTVVGLKSFIKDRDLFLKFSKEAEIDKLIRLISLFGPLILKPPSTFKEFLLKYNLKSATDQDKIILDTTVEPLSIKERDELISIVISDSKDREQIFNLYHKYQNDIIQFKLNLKKWIKIKLSTTTTATNNTTTTTSTSN